MAAKKILGLDLGTNSIGWALIEIDHENGIVKIIGIGSRILPMDAGEIKDFESSGKIKSTAAQRTQKRGPRRVNERYILRRDRLHLILNLLEALPEHYKIEIDFEKNGEKCGQFKTNKEPKLAYLPKQKLGEKKTKFLFQESYQEMLNEIGIKNKKGNRIPYDWTLYYLRQKALTREISLHELAWVLLSYNQKRGYELLEIEDKSSKEGEIVEELDLRVKDVLSKTDEDGRKYYEVHLGGNDNFVYKEYSNKQMTFKDDLKEIEKVSKVDNKGNVDTKNTEFKVIDIYELKIIDVEYKNEDGKHEYTLTFDNGWTEIKNPKNYTFKYKEVIGKSFDYIIETSFFLNGDVKSIRGKERNLREPDFSDNSKDWTLLKKRTEKEALKFNAEKDYVNDDGSIKNFISPKIYDTLKNDALTGIRTKIIGGIFQTVERQFYREELNQIIQTQRRFHTNLEDKDVFEKCVKILYPKNQMHAKGLLESKEAIQHLLVEDILLYQRPLKSKKSEIGNCKYEIRYWQEVVDKETGEIKKDPVFYKVASASHPLFQEFRIWDKLHNLKLVQFQKVDKETGEIKTNVDITKEVFNDEAYQALFEKLNNQKSLNQHQFLTFCKEQFNIPYKKNDNDYVWNFPDDEEIKGNETRVSFATRFKRCGFVNYTDFVTQDKEVELWHYLYSVSYKERTDNNKKSLKTFFNRFLIDSEVSSDVKEKIINDYANYPRFPSRYCAYSEKAMKKLLPFLSMGNNRFKGQFDISNLNENLEKVGFKKSGIKSLKEISENQRQQLYEALWKHSVNIRVEEIIVKLKQVDFNNEKVDFANVIDNDLELPFPKGLFNAFKSCKTPEDFTNLDLTKASYLVYGRHSELTIAKQWTSPTQIRRELHQELKQHSLNNPVAEKVILEMMQVVADIWDYYGEKENSIDEPNKLFDRIHLEVGRELKKSAKEKEGDTQRQSSNRAQNKRIRQVLEEFLAKSPYDANPNNKDHFERLKVIEEGAEHTKNIDKEFFKGKSYSKKEIDDILKKPTITKVEFEKYKLWIEQGYRSPYTNKIIKLTDLFNGDKYNIDHVLPQALVTNNSLSNKVVCEREVNKIKSNQTGREFVNNPEVRQVYCSAHNSKVFIVNDETYVNIVKTQFSGTKRFVLLSKEVPKGFTNSQMNNAKHIARKAMELLSHIVREKGEVEFRSKNVLPVTGRITSELKKVWKLNEVWTELVAPRFIRMNELTNSNLFGQERTSESGHKYFDCNLDKTLREKDESYDIKRIDHRHHALDALIVALCTEAHVNYINNINANTKSVDYGKQIEKYRQTLKKNIMFSRPRKNNPKEKDWNYMLPGEIRKINAESSNRDSVNTKSYFYEDTPFRNDYKGMVLNALEHTIVTFKQNMRVINKTVNRYNNTPNKKNYKKQNTENGQKYNWAIRRSLGKDTFYGKVYLGETENKQLHKCIDEIYLSPELIIENELRNQVLKIKEKTLIKETFENEIKTQFPNKKITLKKMYVASREHLGTEFNSKKIEDITDTGIQKILKTHLQKFDTIELPFNEAIPYFDAVIEKSEFEAIVNNNDKDFSTVQDFINYLKENNYKFKEANHTNLNVFIERNSIVEKVPDRDFRNDKSYKKRIKENPEIAFTPEMIEEMNKPAYMRELNGGKNHAPIKKVRIAKGFGKQRQLSEDGRSGKSKQYVVTDAGSNLYLGVYERTYMDNDGKELRERCFKGIDLMDLIESLKQDKNNRHHPLPDKIFDDKQNEFNRIFMLSPMDLVYVPAEDEIERSDSVDFNNLTKEQMSRIYKYVDGNEDIANFVPFSVSKPLWRFHGKKNKEIYRELNKEGKINIDEQKLIQNEFGLGSQQNKNQNMIDGKVQIKKTCWKLKVDRLGNIHQISNNTIYEKSINQVSEI